MHLTVVNPNTTVAMTALIDASARSVAGPGTRISAVTSPFGPPSVESHYDEALSVPGLLQAVLDAPGSDGFAIACFGDPGLLAAREVAAGPVVGIAEAAMHTACHLGRTFSVVTTLSRTTGTAWELARSYGVSSRCAGVHACDLAVLDLETDPAAYKTVLESCRTALERDRSDVLVLGCAGMADLAAALSAELGVPVVDGVAAAVVTLEGLVRMGLSTSRAGELARPTPKAYSGPLARFSR